MRRVLLACLLFLSGCSFGSSSEAMLRVPSSTAKAGVGRVIAGDNAPLPLPPGNWEESYHFTVGGYERFGYLLVDGDKAPIFVHLTRNVASQAEGFPVDPACYPGPKTNPAAVDLNRGVRNSWDCMLVWPDLAHSDAAAHKDPGIAVELQSLNHFGPLPKYIVGARIIAGYNGNVISESFEFLPEQDGVKGEGWTSDQQTSSEKAYVAAVVTWTAQFRRQVVAAAKGEL